MSNRRSVMAGQTFKPLNGVWHNVADMAKTYQLLNKSKAFASTVAMSMSAQEKAANTWAVAYDTYVHTCHAHKQNPRLI